MSTILNYINFQIFMDLSFYPAPEAKILLCHGHQSSPLLNIIYFNYSLMLKIIYWRAILKRVPNE